MPRFLRKLAWFIQRNRKESELRDELQFHLEEEAEERRSQGLSNEHAYYAARRDLGNISVLKEDTRSTWSWMYFEQFFQDLRYAARTMARNKAFTALVALSLALGIGANTAIFSFMDAVLLRSLPVSDPASLVLLNWHSKQPRHRQSPNETTHVLHEMDGSTYDDPNVLSPAFFHTQRSSSSKRMDRSFPLSSHIIRAASGT